MRRLIMSAGLVAAVIGCAAVALGNDQTDIRAVYAKFSGAMKSKNPAAIMGLVMPDFKEIRINGKVIQGKEAEKALRDRFANTTRVDESTYTPDTITVTGNKAIVWSSYKIKAEIVDRDGKMGAKGKKHIMADNGRSREKLVKTAKGWKIQETHPLKQNPTIDGAPAFRMGPPQRRS